MTMDRQERIERLQREFNDLNAKLEKLQKFMSDFYYMISHDPMGADPEIFANEPMLIEQEKAMIKYRKALAVRISFMIMHTDD